MSRLGASQTSRTRDVPGASCGRLDDFFGDAHARFSQTSSATALPASRAFVSYLVIGRATEMGRPSSAVTRVSRGSASPTSAICSA